MHPCWCHSVSPWAWLWEVHREQQGWLGYAAGFSPAFPPGLPHGELGDGVTEPTSPPAGFPGLGQVQDQVSLSPKLAVKGFQARAAVYLQAGVILHCFIYKTQKDILSVDFFFLQTKEYARSGYWDLEDFSGESGPSHAVWQVTDKGDKQEHPKKVQNPIAFKPWSWTPNPQKNNPKLHYLSCAEKQPLSIWIYLWGFGHISITFISLFMYSIHKAALSRHGSTHPCWCCGCHLLVGRFIPPRRGEANTKVFRGSSVIVFIFHLISLIAQTYYCQVSASKAQLTYHFSLVQRQGDQHLKTHVSPQNCYQAQPGHGDSISVTWMDPDEQPETHQPIHSGCTWGKMAW